MSCRNAVGWSPTRVMIQNVPHRLPVGYGFAIGLLLVRRRVRDGAIGGEEEAGSSPAATSSWRRRANHQRASNRPISDANSLRSVVTSVIVSGRDSGLDEDGFSVIQLPTKNEMKEKRQERRDQRRNKKGPVRRDAEPGLSTEIAPPTRTERRRSAGDSCGRATYGGHDRPRAASPDRPGSGCTPW